jgi:hypothetical protein
MCPSRDESLLRQPSHKELALLERLTSEDFDGAKLLQEQLVKLRVATIDDEGSLKLEPGSAALSTNDQRIPVEADYSDADGVVVHVLLHVVKGKLDELEVYREDSGRVLRPVVEVSNLNIRS